MSAARQLLNRSPDLLKRCLRPCLPSHSAKSSLSSSSAFLPWHQFLSYATRAAHTDNYISEVLKSQINHELRQQSDKGSFLKGSTGPFEILDKPGTEEIMLIRAFGKEKISIACIVETQYPDVADEDAVSECDEEGIEVASSQGKPQHVLHLFVTIRKEAETPALELECSFTRGDAEVSIESIAFSTENLDPADVAGPQPYQGPPFEELDENLRKAFHELLKTRGLSTKVATYVLDYMSMKDRREYARWLRKVEAFFSN